MQLFGDARTIQVNGRNGLLFAIAKVFIRTDRSVPHIRFMTDLEIRRTTASNLLE